MSGLDGFWSKEAPKGQPLEFPTAKAELERRKDPKEKVRDEFGTVRQRVFFLLKKYPRARDDYQYLQWRYAIEFGGLKYLPEEEFQKLMAINFTTVERCCRLIQHDPELPAEILKEVIPTTAEIREKRKIREGAIRMVLGTKTI